MWWILIYRWTAGWRQGSHAGKQIIWRQPLQHVGPRSEADNIKVLKQTRSHWGWWTSKLVQQEEEESATGSCHNSGRRLRVRRTRTPRVHYEAALIKSSGSVSCLRQETCPTATVQTQELWVIRRWAYFHQKKLWAAEKRQHMLTAFDLRQLLTEFTLKKKKKKKKKSCNEKCEGGTKQLVDVF